MCRFLLIVDADAPVGQQGKGRVGRASGADGHRIAPCFSFVATEEKAEVFAFHGVGDGVEQDGVVVADEVAVAGVVHLFVRAECTYKVKASSILTTKKLSSG